MPAPDFIPDNNWARPVVGRVTPARGIPIPVSRHTLSDDDIERIARRVVELLKERESP